jgi:hypothetical protein
VQAQQSTAPDKPFFIYCSPRSRWMCVDGTIEGGTVFLELAEELGGLDNVHVAAA